MNHYNDTPARRWHPLLLCGWIALQTVPAAAYQLSDLGADVTPADINNAGTIVGAYRTDAGNVAFVMPAGGPLQDIPGATSATAVNDSGQVTGVTADGAFLLDGRITQWTGYGAYGINASGQISGYVQQGNPYRASPLPLAPAVYTPNQWDYLDVAHVYPRGTRKGVYADQFVLHDINTAGFSVGTHRRYGLGGSSAFLTTPAFDTVIYLPIPNGGTAAAINDDNLVVGATGSDTSTGQYSHAYLYDYNAGSLRDLGTLGGGLTSSAADINTYGQVVGTSRLVTQLTSAYDPAQYHAFLWQNGVLGDLNDTLPAGSGWILTAAAAINDDGDIVGTGLLNGVAHGFLLSTNQGPPPPPSTGQPPVAMAGADVTSGRAPLTVSFSAAGSYDPDGTNLAYAWDFGDGSAVASDPNPTHVYTVPGKYTAVLSLTDGDGMTATATVAITVRKATGGRKP
jgi:probable HAF family extracellular repeat protein